MPRSEKPTAALQVDEFKYDEFSTVPSYVYDDEDVEEAEEDNSCLEDAVNNEPPAESGVPFVVRPARGAKAPQTAEPGRRPAPASAVPHAREDADSARAWLEAQGVMPGGMSDAAAVQLQSRMSAHVDVLATELADVGAMTGVNVGDRRALVSGPQGGFTFAVEAAWGYPTGGQPVLVECGREALTTALGHAVGRSALRGQPGLLTAVVRTCLALIGEAASAGPPEVASAWACLTGERLDLECPHPLHEVRTKHLSRPTVGCKDLPPSLRTVSTLRASTQGGKQARRKRGRHLPFESEKQRALDAIVQLERSKRAGLRSNEEYAYRNILFVEYPQCRKAIARTRRSDPHQQLLDAQAIGRNVVRNEERSLRGRLRAVRNALLTNCVAELPSLFEAVAAPAPAAKPPARVVKEPPAAPHREPFATKLARMVEDPSITTLQHTDPSLRAVRPSIARLGQVTVLNLSGCALSTLPSLGSMQLQKVYLSRNDFTVFPEALLVDGVQSNLRVLDMSHNRLQKLPAALGEFTRLELMLFDYNMVRRLPPLGRLERLEVIEFIDNDIRLIPPAVGHLPRLWRLRLGANPVANVPPQVYFAGLRAVQEFLRERGMYVPASELSEEVVDLHRRGAPPEGGCDVEVVVMPEGDDGPTAVPACSFILCARLPGLLRVASMIEALDDGDATGVTHRLLCPATALCGSAEDAVAALRLAVRLAAGDLAGSELREVSDRSPTTAAALAGLVEAHGTGGLQRGLTALHTEGGYIAKDELVADLEAAVGWWCAAPPPPAAAAAAGSDYDVGAVVTLVVGGAKRRFRAHRALLQRRCPYFASMFASGMVEGTAGLVELPEVDPDVFESVLTYVYAGTSRKMGPQNVVALLFLAAEYQMDRLRAMAECVVGYNMEVENVAQILQMAHLLDSANLKKVCFHFMRGHDAAVRSSPSFRELQPELRREYESGEW